MSKLTGEQLAIVLLAAAEARQVMQAMVSPHSQHDDDVETARALRRAQVGGAVVGLGLGLVVSVTLDTSWPLVLAVAVVLALAYEHQRAIEKLTGGALPGGAWPAMSEEG